ncbi:MAG: glycogen synthase GlgA [Schwartzia sp.]|nr:glycogen synthase GlgA [Schwartzia sp. (in: firmicutes)]
MLKVLYVASEAVPFVKTGGLADVAGSLPKALAGLGVDVRVMLPKYAEIPKEYRDKMKHIYHGAINVSWREKYVGVDELKMNGVTFYFVDNEEYFGRDGFYGYGDDAERFSFFSRAVLNLLPEIDFWPDIIHSNDWHTALVSVFLKLEHMGDERYEKIRTMFTIHNLKYQGVFPKNIMGDVLGLSWDYFNNGDLEYYDAVNFMKGAIIYADCITTVSRTYAEEIQYPFFGEGLDGLLRSRSNALFGIVNGIDYDVYNPHTDKALAVNYGVNEMVKKVDNKMALQKELHLPRSPRTPLVGMVSRLVEAKGLDLVIRVLDELLEHEDMQFVIIGVGDKVYEDWFRELAWRRPDKVSVNIFFNNDLAQRIYASSDLFLMPSLFEPCGIGQLIAMKYGAVPVVRSTGGLEDTVKPYNKSTGEGNGFTFPNYNAHELMYSVKRAFGLYRDMQSWQVVVRNAMITDFGWYKSAQEYKSLYERIKK